MNAPLIELLGPVSNRAQTRQPGTAADLFSVLLGNIAAGLGKGVAPTASEETKPAQNGQSKATTQIAAATGQVQATTPGQTPANQATVPQAIAPEASAPQNTGQEAAQPVAAPIVRPTAVTPTGEASSNDQQESSDPDEAAVLAALGLTVPAPVPAQPEGAAAPVQAQAAAPATPPAAEPAPPAPPASPGDTAAPDALPPAAGGADQTAQPQQAAAKLDAAPLPIAGTTVKGPAPQAPVNAPQTQPAANAAVAQPSEPKPAAAATAPQTAPTAPTDSAKPAIVASNAATQRPSREAAPEAPRALRPASARSTAKTPANQTAVTAAAQAKQAGAESIMLQRSSTGGTPQTPAALADRLAAMTTPPSHDPVTSSLNLAGADKLAATPQIQAEGALPQLQQSGAASHETSHAGNHAARGLPTAPAAQIAVQLSRALNGQTQRFSIRLEPAELGRVDVQLAFHRNGSVRATIAAERAETLDLLQKDSQGLQRALEDLGADPDKLDLSFNLSGQQRQDGETDDGGFRGDLAAATGKPVIGETKSDEAPPVYTRVDGLVDLMI